jgi:alkaline phosphatase
MDRRKFFKYGSLATAGAALLSPIDILANEVDFSGKGKTAKNIIMLISDGMSTGTLNMADLYLNRIHGRSSNWMQLYKDHKVSRALMDTASASSIVTDSSAASSAFGGGVRVKNGSLNVNEDGSYNTPILQKFKKAGKKVGCVTTVAITHATPAGFSVNSSSRYAQPEIADTYHQLGFDVMMGGGNIFFSPEKREDKKDVYSDYQQKGYQILRNRQDLMKASTDKPILGVFDEDALPYSIDRNASEGMKNNLPTLAEMAQKAIDSMKNHKGGFALQIEGGKVDWAAHANDIAALIHDQIAFDEAVKVAIDFAEKDGNTLVIITTDHGNANPGVIYGKTANNGFDSIAKFTQTNEWILNQIKEQDTIHHIKELIEFSNGFALTNEEATKIKSYYDGLEVAEDGLYNYKNLPFKYFSEIQKPHSSVGWISMDHSGDYVELAMFGPGSENLKPFVKNTDLHYLMLEAAGLKAERPLNR